MLLDFSAHVPMQLVSLQSQLAWQAPTSGHDPVKVESDAPQWAPTQALHAVCWALGFLQVAPPPPGGPLLQPREAALANAPSTTDKSIV
jgi:hypothetical protein